MHIERLYPTFCGSDEYRPAQQFLQDINPMSSAFPTVKNTYIRLDKEKSTEVVLVDSM